MLRPKRMTKIKIVGPRTQRASLIETLHALKLLHLVDHKKTEELDIGTPEQHAEEIAKLIIKARSLIATFQKEQTIEERTQKETETILHTVEEVKQNIGKVAEYASKVYEGKKQIEKTIAEKKESVVQLQLLAALEVTTDALKPYKALSTFIGTITGKRSKEQQSIKNEIQKIAKEVLIKTAITTEGTAVAVFVKKKQEAAVAKLLEGFGYKQYAFKDLSLYPGNPKEQAKKEEISVQLLEKDLAHRETEAEKLEMQYGSYVRSAEKWLRKEAEKAEAPVRCAETKHAFMIDGWVSAKEYESLKMRLEQKVENKVHVKILEVKKTDKIPIIMDNLFFVKPFEFFLNLYTLPSYKEMDPSFLMFFSFPFFFGLMLGDVGYGLITLLLFAGLWWKMRKARNLLTAMILCAIVSIFFGVVFGEYFGFEHVSEETGNWLVKTYNFPLHEETLHSGEVVYTFPRLMNRLHGEMEILGNTLPSILVIGAILGFIHVNLGLFLGFINEVVSHGFKHAFFAKISWYVLELGIACAVLSMLGMISLPWTVGLGIGIIAAAMLFKGEGIQGLVEIPGIMTNVLSYLRLGAVGLSSVGLAVVINENLALPFIEKGGMFIALGIIIFILGHLINIALGVIGPFLHSLRLHYVEFFSKFYKGGGIHFVAFGEEKE